MKAVLDTNIVLDWLVFADPSTQFLQAARVSRRVEVVANIMSIAELQRVLTYPQFNLSVTEQQDVLTAYQSNSSLHAMPATFSPTNLQLPAGFPLCRDHDDDHFLALAFHSAAALVTKDKALLALRKKVSRFGMRVATLGELRSMLASDA